MARRFDAFVKGKAAAKPWYTTVLREIPVSTPSVVEPEGTGLFDGPYIDVIGVHGPQAYSSRIRIGSLSTVDGPHIAVVDAPTANDDGTFRCTLYSFVQSESGGTTLEVRDFVDHTQLFRAARLGTREDDPRIPGGTVQRLISAIDDTAEWVICHR